MKFALCNEMYIDRTIFDVIEHAAGLGYDGLELAPYTLTDDIFDFPVDKQRAIARCAEDNGIELAGMHWLLVKPEGLHINCPDAAIRQKTQDVFKQLIEISVNLNARMLTLGSPNQRSYTTNDTLEDTVARTVEFFRTLAPELEMAGSTLALEPLETSYTNFITRTIHACDLVDSIGSKSIGITLDTHFLRWECEQYGNTTLQAFQLAGSRLAHLHIQDDNFKAPGTGSVDFSAFTEAVKHVDWHGYISMETFKDDTPITGEQLAEDGIAFMKTHF